MLYAEASYMENIPENLKNGSLYETAEEAVSALEEAINLLTEVY
jgi:predicted RNase H-like HicB family nuclease